MILLTRGCYSALYSTDVPPNGPLVGTLSVKLLILLGLSLLGRKYYWVYIKKSMLSCLNFVWYVQESLGYPRVTWCVPTLLGSIQIRPS